MKRILRIAVSFACIVSCTAETLSDTATVPSDRGPAAEPEVSRTAQENFRGMLPGKALVYVSEELAEQLEKKASEPAEWSLLKKEIKLTGSERLFPDAGEYEPRTRREGLHRWYIVDYSRDIAPESAIETIGAVPGIQSAEPCRVIRQHVAVNDPHWSKMWGMNNTTYPGYDVNCKPVWDNYTMGRSNVTVAVVDGGFQLNHPDLAANVAASGHYNYVDNNTTIYQHFHGTHVAGTIGAVNNNGTGVTGIAGGNAAAGQLGVKLLSLQVFKTLDNGQDASAANFSRALKEAADKGALISQNSWGHYFDFNEDGQITGYELTYARNAHENPERSFTQAVDYFNKYAGCDNDGNQKASSPMKGGVVIFAAGNEDIPYGSPGNYDGCLSVGAINRNGTRAYFSNYGEWVDICAPGVDVYSTYLSGQYTYMSGTSMACPHASGVAALVLSHLGGPGFTADELRARLTTGAKAIAPSTGSKPIGPLVDAMGAINMNASGKRPDKIEDAKAAAVGHNLTVDFTSNGAYAYMAIAGRQKSAVANADLYNPSSALVTATRIASASDTQGTPMSILLAGLAPDTDYYVTVVAYSYDKKFSPLSDIQTIRTGQNQKPVYNISDYPVGGFSFPHHSIVSLPVTFRDPDGDAMTVTFKTSGRASLDPNNGSEGLYNFKLMCPLAAPGSYTATLEVKDEVGASTRGTIFYTILPNTAPEKVKDFEVVLLESETASAEIKLGEYFSDPDGEPLFFRATSMDAKVASATVDDDGKLTVSAVSSGVCTVQIVAEDHESERVEAPLTVLVRPKDSPEVFMSGSNIVTGGNLTVIPGIEESLTRVRLISATGAVVYSKEAVCSAASPIVIGTDSLAPGIYGLEVVYKKKTYTFNIVKR